MRPPKSLDRINLVGFRVLMTYLLHAILSYAINVDLDAPKLIFNVDRNLLPSQTY